jgi:phosphoribosylamine--glycine ligase
MAIEQGKLGNASIEWDDDCAVSVVLASKGYPGKYNTGKVITGIDVAEAQEGITVYHAGTKLSDTGDILTAGGRVLDVTAVAPTFEEARERAYAAVGLIDFEGKEFRTDIGAKAMR